MAQKTQIKKVKKVDVHYHFETEMTLPSGLTVLGTSLDNEERLTYPDWGLYADHDWRPVWRAEFITWRDFGLPTAYEPAVYAMLDTYDRIHAGERVEIGCRGGHGRTGTILACLGVIEGLTHDEAIRWVRTNFCEKAIETDEQEWFVNWVQCYLDNTEPPEKPMAWMDYIKSDKKGYRLTTTTVTEGGLIVSSGKDQK